MKEMLVQVVSLLRVGSLPHLAAQTRIVDRGGDHIGPELARGVTVELLTIEVAQTLLIIKVETTIVDRVTTLVPKALVHTSVMRVDLHHKILCRPGIKSSRQWS